jgi:hypothetical protein
LPAPVATFLFTQGDGGANAIFRRGGAQDGKGFAGNTTTLTGFLSGALFVAPGFCLLLPFWILP